MHSPEHKRKKHEARQDALHHFHNSAVHESRAEREAAKDVANMYYQQERNEYAEKVREDQQENMGRNPPRVPKAMLEREYEKSPGGGLVHKKKGSY